MAQEIIAAVQRELANYPGVTMEAFDRGKHRRLVFESGKNSRFLSIPKTPSDWRASHNTLRDFRKTMKELGAERSPPLARRSKMGKLPSRKGVVATFAMNDKIVALHIPAKSKLLGRFKTKDAKAAAHWSFSLRPSVDLAAPPLLVVSKGEVPAGLRTKSGLVAGFGVAGAWRLTMGRSMFPALSDRFDELPTTPLKLYEERADELVFQFPPETVPTGFTRPLDQAKADSLTSLEESGLIDHLRPEPAPLPSEAWREAPAPRAEPVAMLPDQPITLQLPKQGVSVEAAIAVLNKAKRRLGTNLRFTIEEGGYLSAIHRIGH